MSTYVQPDFKQTAGLTLIQ